MKMHPALIALISVLGLVALAVIVYAIVASLRKLWPFEKKSQEQTSDEPSTQPTTEPSTESSQAVAKTKTAPHKQELPYMCEYFAMDVNRTTCQDLSNLSESDQLKMLIEADQIVKPGQICFHRSDNHNKCVKPENTGTTCLDTGDCKNELGESVPCCPPSSTLVLGKPGEWGGEAIDMGGSITCKAGYNPYYVDQAKNINSVPVWKQYGGNKMICMQNQELPVPSPVDTSCDAYPNCRKRPCDTLAHAHFPSAIHQPVKGPESEYWLDEPLGDNKAAVLKKYPKSTPVLQRWYAYADENNIETTSVQLKSKCEAKGGTFVQPPMARLA